MNKLDMDRRKIKFINYIVNKARTSSRGGLSGSPHPPSSPAHPSRSSHAAPAERWRRRRSSPAQILYGSESNLPY